MALSPTGLSPEARPVPCDDDGLSSRDLGDELLIYDRGSDQVHMLNGTARDIYLLCDGKRTVAQILDCFADRYDVERSAAYEAARETLAQLADLGALRFD